MNVSSHEALELCRGLLAFSAPGLAVAVPHAALAQVVELASGAASAQAHDSAVEALQDLFDVAALARRYNRATTTVRQWFHDGLFGPPAERRFRGRGYVAPAEAVREFETRTGLKSVVTDIRPIEVLVDSPAETESASQARPARKRKSTPPRAGALGGKIFAAQGGLRARRSA